MSESEQHQDELLKQEKLIEILSCIWSSCVEIEQTMTDEEIFYLASALGLSSELKKRVLVE